MEGYLDKIEDILKRWNNAKKEDITREGKFNKSDVWKEGIDFIFNDTFLKNNPRNPNSSVKPIILFKQLIMDYIKTQIKNTQEEIKLAEQNKLKELKLDAKDKQVFIAQSKMYLVSLNKIREDINKIYTTIFLKDTKPEI